MTPRTLVDIFRSLADTPKPDLLLHKQGGKWIPISTAEFMDRVKSVSCALEGLGVKQGGRVALLSENRPEWAIVDFACQCYGAVLVPIFPTMVAEQVAYLMKDSGTTIAFASTSEQAAKILAAKEASPEVKQALKHVIVFDASSLAGTTPYASILETGRAAQAADPSAFEKRADARQPSDLATLIYTSGTTGEPKGAMLMQSNFVSNAVAGQLGPPLRLQCRGAVVPAALARFRALHRVLLLLPVGHDRIRRIDRQTARQPLRGEPAPLRRGPPCLRESLRARAGDPLEVVAGQAEALREGNRGREESHGAPREEADAGFRPCPRALRLREARVPQGARGPGFPLSLRDLRRRASREGARGVLLGGRRRGLRGLRTHGNEPRHRGRLPCGVAAGHGGEDSARRRVPHRA